MPQPYWKVCKIATVARKVANRRRLAYRSLAAIIAIVAILHTFQYGRGIIGRSITRLCGLVRISRLCPPRRAVRNFLDYFQRMLMAIEANQIWFSIKAIEVNQSWSKVIHVQSIKVDRSDCRSDWSQSKIYILHQIFRLTSLVIW